MSKRAAILARISDADAGETAGVDDQVKDMRAFVTRRGWSLDEAHVLVENDTSAFKRRKIRLPNGRTELRTVRPKFRKALELLATRQVDVLVVLDLDRLARQPRDLEDLIDLVEESRFAVTCESLTGSAQLTSDAGITMARIMCAVANKSSKDTARRVSRARQRQAENGQFGGGGRPYGFETDGATIRESEAAELRKMADAVLSKSFGEKGGQSLASIAADLRERNVPTTKGKPWRTTTVRDVLLRPRNAALMVYKPGDHGRVVYTKADVIGSAPWAPIIPEDRYWQIVAKLTDPARRTNTGTSPAPAWLCSGIATCPCGSVVRAYKASQKANRPVYRCTERGQGHATIPVDALDAYVTEAVLFRLGEDDAIKSAIAPAAKGIDVGALRVKRENIKRAMTELGIEKDEGEITKAEYTERRKRLQVKLDDIERQLADVNEVSPFAPFVGADDVEAVWKGLSLGAQRELVKILVDVRLKRVGRGRRVDVEERFELIPR